MIQLLRCYAAAVPFFVWALLLELGVSDADGTRVPFLLAEGVAVLITISGLRNKYGKLP